MKCIDSIDFNIFNDSFINDVENYIKDQYVFRDASLKIKSTINKILQKKISNGVYVLNDRYIEKEPTLDYDYIAFRTNDLLNEFNDIKTEVDFVLLPNAYNINHDKLPLYSEKSYQKDVFTLLDNTYSSSLVKFLNLSQKIEDLYEKGIDIYYRTDHHMTSEAVYNIKDDIFLSLGINDDRQYNKVKVCDSFQGSLMSKSGIFTDIVDDIYLYLDTKPLRYVVTDFQNNKKTASIYDFDKINSYDPYLVFVGSNGKLINIKTENYYKKRLLVIKDSYANCFIPYLIPYFSNIDIVDPRYVENIKDIVDYDEYDNILVFYNMNTYLTKE